MMVGFQKMGKTTILGRLCECHERVTPSTTFLQRMAGEEPTPPTRSKGKRTGQHNPCPYISTFLVAVCVCVCVCVLACMRVCICTSLTFGKGRHFHKSFCTSKIPFTSFVFTVLCSTPLYRWGGPWHMEVPQGSGARIPQAEEEGSQAASQRHVLHLGLWRTGTCALYTIYIYIYIYIIIIYIYIVASVHLFVHNTIIPSVIVNYLCTCTGANVAHSFAYKQFLCECALQLATYMCT